MNNHIIPTIAPRLEDLINDMGLECRVTPDYSGRGMFGSTCFGIVASNPIMSAAVLTLVLAEDDFGDGIDVIELFSVARTDNMGYDTIIYFPGWSLEA